MTQILKSILVNYRFGECAEGKHSSGHPLGLFKSSPASPRAIITNAMMIGLFDDHENWERAMDGFIFPSYVEDMQEEPGQGMSIPLRPAKSLMKCAEAGPILPFPI
ncbi:MAG: hypothetical protein U9N77_16775 [Thermodesulfobacteriota bacterium]|nr:hypothetical protein [Thermodesulfobacteriota bacterium]